MTTESQAMLRMPLYLLVLLLAGCASQGTPPHGTLDEIHAALRDDDTASRSQQKATPPAAVSDALLPAIQLNIPGADLTATEPRFDVKVRNAAARDFFLSLVEGTAYNVMVHPDVGGRISLDVKNVTVPEVMEMVRDTYGYDFERRGNYFQVLPNVLQTRIFPVNYLDIKRSGSSKISAGATQISRSGGTSSNGTTTSTTSTSETSQITTDSQSNFWPALEATLRTIVGSEAGRSVTVNPQAGLVVVRAMPGELRAVKDYLDSAQSATQRQVILEARILEVELSDGFQSGINWSALTRRGSDYLALGQTGGGSISNGTGVTANVGAAINMTAPAGTATGSFLPATALGGVFAAALTTQNFTAFIELLKSQGNVQVLSSPRISTLNNQKAVIKVGADEFFVTDVNTTTTTTTTTATPNVSVELTPFFSGVTLDVTPQISAEGDIILHVRPSVSEVREQVKDVAVATTNLRMPLASSTVRESDSLIRARNGQIVVIGGLMQNKTRDEQYAVPLLGDLPLVGALFRHNRQATRKSELVILLRPTVVAGDEQWSHERQRSAAGFRQFDPQP